MAINNGVAEIIKDWQKNSGPRKFCSFQSRKCLIFLLD